MIYKAIGDFGDLMRDAAKAKAELQGMADAVKAETAAEVAGSTQAAAARGKDIAAIQQQAQALSQLASAAKNTNSQLLYGGRNTPEQHLSDLAQELNYTTLLNRQRWLGFSSVQQATAYRQQMYNLALLENRAHFAGYQTADQYISFLQREISQTAALSAAIRDRSAAIANETTLLVAHTNALQGTRQSAGSLGEQLTGATALSAAIAGLPTVVTTRAELDTSAAMAELATYRAALLALPHSERTDILSVATRLGGIPLTAQRETVPVSLRPQVDYAAVNRMLSQALSQERPGAVGLPAGIGGGQPLAAMAEETDALSAALSELNGKAAISAEVVSKFQDSLALAAVDARALEQGIGRLAAAEQLLAETSAQFVPQRQRGRAAVPSGPGYNTLADLYGLQDVAQAVRRRDISGAPGGYPVLVPVRLVPPSRAEEEGLWAGLSQFMHARPVKAEVQVEGGPEAEATLDKIAVQMEWLDSHDAKPKLTLEGGAEAAAEAMALDDELRAIPPVVDTVLVVESSGAAHEVRDYSRDIEDIEREVGTRASFEDTEAESGLSRWLTALIEAVQHKYEFYASFNDEAAKAELAGWISELETARAAESRLSAGMGGASGGGGGGGPPVPPPSPPAAGGEPNPNDRAAWEAVAAELNKVDALFRDTGQAAITAGNAGAKAGQATAAAVTSMVLPLTNGARGWFGLLTQVNLFGGLLPGVLAHTTALHFVLDAILETIAVLVPALVTMAAGLTAFGVAGYDAGKQVYDRMQAVHTVMDATNSVIPPMTGNLEKLHNAVRPQVWQLFGDALTIVNTRSGLFNQLAVQTGNVVDRLAARLTVDMTSAGSGLNTFLSIGAQNLAKLGVIFHNIGLALLSFIKVTQDTHIDQIFLNIFVALSQFLVLVTKLPTPLLAAVVGLHAFWLWGGLLATVVMQLLNPLRALALALGAVDAASVAGGLGSLGKDVSAWEKLKAGLTDIAAGFGALPGRLNIFSKSAGEAATAAKDVGVATEGAGVAATDTAAAGGGLVAMFGRLGPALSNPYVLIGALAVALAGVGVYLGMLPDATQKWINSLNQALAKASALTVVSTTVGNLAAVTNELAVAQAKGVGNVTELAGAQRGLSNDLSNELTHVGAVSKAYGTDFVGALNLLQAAGVKTSDIFSAQGLTWASDLQQVKGLVQGYAAMGQGLSALQKDVSVQLVNTSDQVTAMGKLNTAWDTWTTTVAGAPSAFLAMAKGFQQFTTDAKAAGASMTGLTAPSLTLQGDFQSNYTNVQKFFDAFRNDQALTGQGDFTKFVKDAVASLIPMAGGSKEAAAQISALAQEAGGPATDNIKTLQQWVGNIKSPLEAMYKASNEAAIGASNLSQDAARLTTTLQQQLDPAMAHAIFNAHGGQQVFNDFADALAKSGPKSSATVSAARSVATELLAVTGSSGSAKAEFVGFAEAMGLNSKQADQLWKQASSHITANLGEVRKGLEKTATSTVVLGSPGLWGQVEHFFMAFWDGIFNWFKNSLPHAFEVAWDAVFHWFASTVPHALESAWDPVARFFENAFTHDIPHWWSTAWANTVSPVTHAFDDVKNWVTSNFDNWWKTHGSAVEKIWSTLWSQIRNDALSAWHFIETDVTTAWHVITSIFTSGPAKGIWKFIENEAVAAWQMAVTGARGAWIEIEGLAKAAWAVVSALAKIAWDVIWQFVGAGAKGAVATLVGIFKAGWALVQAVAKIVWDAIVLIINEVLDIITGHWHAAWKDLQSFGIQVWNALKQAGIQMWNALSTATLQVWNAIWNAIKTAAGQVWNALKTGAVQAWNAIWSSMKTTFINPMASFFTSTVPQWWDKFAGFATSTWSKVWSGFQKNVLQPIENFFTNTLPSAMWNSLRGGIDHVIDGLNTVIGWINSVTSVVGVHIGTISKLASGGVAPSRMAHGSVPGTGDEDGTHIIAMGGEYILRKPARMALQAAYGPDFLNYLNQADSWLGAGSRGSAATQRPSHGGRYAAGGIPVLSDIGNWLGSAGSAIAGAASSVWHGITDAAAEVAKFGEKAVFDAMWSVSGAPAEKAMEALGTPGDMGASWLQTVHNGVENYINAQTAKAQAQASKAAISTAGVSNSSALAALQSAAAKKGWTGAQWVDLYNVEMREAGFNLTATNPSSGAYGMAQFINGPSEYYTYGGNPNTAAGQAVAMVNYIAQRYGTPAAAWAHEQAFNWYGSGGPVDLASMLHMASGGPVISAGHVISVDNNEAIIGWTGQDAAYYTTLITGPGPINGHTGRTTVPKGYFGGLDAGHTYNVAVTPWSAGGTKGGTGIITLVTTKGPGHVLTDTSGSGSTGSGSSSGTGTGSGAGAGSPGSSGSPIPPPVPGSGNPIPTGVRSAPGGGSAGPTVLNLAPLIIGGPQVSNAGGYGFNIASGGNVPSDVAAMFSGGMAMAAGGVVPSLFVPGLSANLSRQLTAATSGQLPRSLSDAAGSRVGLKVDQLTINNPKPEKPSESITRASNRLAFLGGRGMV